MGLRGSAHCQRFSERKPLVAAASWSVGGGALTNSSLFGHHLNVLGVGVGLGHLQDPCPPASVSFRPCDFGQVT